MTEQKLCGTHPEMTSDMMLELGAIYGETTRVQTGLWGLIAQLEEDQAQQLLGVLECAMTARDKTALLLAQLNPDGDAEAHAVH